MANIFRSKEVYKHLKYDLHNRNEMVAVQGVYITGEYRPPYYNEPCVHIYEISGQDCIVANFESEEVDTSPSETSGMYKFGMDFVGYMKTYYSTQSEESTPEPTLRLSSLTSENCVITNYNRTRSDE